LNTDHYFSIGHTHDVCEDYALSGVENNVAYAIVCDGCSSPYSDYVDFGARALAFAARSLAVYMTDLFFSAGTSELGHLIIDKASVIQRLGTEANCLDATVLIAAVSEKRARICMWGDGVCVLRFGEKRNTVFRIEYESGAPYYLSYRLTPNRLQSYLVQFDKPKAVDTLMTAADGSQTTGRNTMAYTEVFDLRETLSPGSQISLISDGINQFKNATSESIGWATLIDQFTSYKNTKGVFVQRRMKFFKRECAKYQITHDDDISVATLIV
jgi:Protein phosphatase 2C